MELVFGLERETKNTYRFQELNVNGEPGSYDENVVGTLYIQKSIFNGKKPEKVAVTLHLDGEEEEDA